MARAGRAGTPLPLPARREGAVGVAPRGGPRRGGAGAWGLGRGVGKKGREAVAPKEEGDSFHEGKIWWLGTEIEMGSGGEGGGWPKTDGTRKKES